MPLTIKRLLLNRFVTIVFTFLFFNLPLLVTAQEDSMHEVQLEEVVIKAFEQNTRLKNIPAAVNYIGGSDLSRFNSNSLVSAINSTPGIRMEERSPGSYRINIRGSSLRSPFGVRNVKVYYNDLPITDPGGTTYLNNLTAYNISSIEVIKGPGSSLYGAGMGGALLIENSPGNDSSRLGLSYTGGSFGYQNAVSFGNATENFKNKISLQHQQSDGYRDHSRLRHDVASWVTVSKIGNKASLKTTFLYSDLYYQTPGALTLAEYQKNPKAARPAVGTSPSSEQSKAAIYEKMVLAGLSYTLPISQKFKNTTSVYGLISDLKNPAIRNYGHNMEPHTGGRTIFSFQQNLDNGYFLLNAGGEWQQSFSSYSVHDNVDGKAGNLQTFDEVPIRQSFAFLQGSVNWRGWNITAGGSLNATKFSFHRTAPIALPAQTTFFHNRFVPRISVLKIIQSFTVYSSIAKGFSPPTTDELLPTGSDINLSLQPEEGINHDLGLRASIHHFYVDVNAFWFQLKNSIVQRRTASGGDYYLNSGKTSQKGIEAYTSYSLASTQNIQAKNLIWFSYTLHQFRYKNFIQLANDYSGNRMPGEAPNTVAAGIDYALSKQFYVNLTYFFSDKIPLSDANDAYANAYHLIGAKINYKKDFRGKHTVQIFAGADNILNVKYSLGNDINGFGGRYYNVAPGRSFYAGFNLSLGIKK